MFHLDLKDIPPEFKENENRNWFSSLCHVGNGRRLYKRKSSREITQFCILKYAHVNKLKIHIVSTMENYVHF